MTEKIKPGRDGDLLVVLESSEGFPAAGLVARKLGEEGIRIFPAELLPSQPPEGDMLVACRVGSKAARAVFKTLGLRAPPLAPGAYRIDCVPHGEGRVPPHLL